MARWTFLVWGNEMLNLIGEVSAEFVSRNIPTDKHRYRRVLEQHREWAGEWEIKKIKE